jgi:Putative transposase/Transposase zinc-binding domain
VSSPALEVADVLRRHGDAYRSAHPVDRSAARVMGAITACRTAVLGGHVERCDSAACGFTRVAYNSCRNRHCPKCQSGAARDWLAERAADLLPVEYFHVVFTLPAPVAAIAKQNKAVVYGLLFEAAAETLKTIAADPRHLGAGIGMTMVLHTWGQTLTYHPHVHVIVPGGGLSEDGGSWIACRPGFFLPVKVLQRLYRRLFLAKLAAAHASGRLQFFDALAPLSDARAFARHLAPVRRTDWVVYAKKPFAGPGQVLRYLARYTHRIAISNRRLVTVGDTGVTFTWKDYRHGAGARCMTLAAGEFIRRFLLHVLPDGFQRIRHYGFLANGHRKAKLAVIRRLLVMPAASPVDAAQPEPVVTGIPDQPTAAAPDTTPLCPCCGGRMRITEVLADPRRRASRLDSS